MKKPYTEPTMEIEIFEDAIATEGINRFGSDIHAGGTHAIIEEDEEY